MLAWARTAGDDRRVVAVSFARDEALLALDGWVVEVSTSGQDGVPFGGTLSADEAVLLRPAPST